MTKSKVFLQTFFTLMIFLSSALAYTPQFADGEKNVRLRWKENKIPVSISKSLLEKSTNIKANSDVLGAIERSLKRWEEVADIEFQFSVTDTESVSAKGSSGDGVSLITIAPTAENLLLFDEKIDEASAMTRLFYNAKGEIKEADIVLNPVLLFTTDGTFGTFDLEATLTHEIGHFLGLGHSQVIGSTMHSHQGKNGIYNLPGFSSRTLSDDDKAGAISLYGHKTDEQNCCEQIEGTLAVSNSKITREFHVWAEDFHTGKVIAGVSTDSDGKFNIRGLPRSVYKIYAQDSKKKSATVYLGEVDLNQPDLKPLNKKFRLELKDFNADYVGFNGQLSSLAVPVNAGKSYIIYVGGKNLTPESLEIGFHSENFKVDQASIIEHNYGDGLSVISFEVEINENTPVGEYSFYLKSLTNKFENLIGGLTVEEIVNPWNNKSF